MTRVLIVGAGPGGASLAYLLAHRGVEVTLLERQNDFAREFRGEILLPSGVEALHQMGLAETLQGVPTEIQDSIELYLNGRPVFRQDLSGEWFRAHPPQAISQPLLLETLVAAANRSPTFRLERGASVKELLFENKRVVGVRARTATGEKRLNADLVVGADGRASVVRKQGGFTSRHVSPPLDVVWCKLPCPDDWAGPRIYMGRGNLLLSYRSWDGQLQLAWIIVKGSFGDLKSRGIQQWIRQMENHVSSDLASHLRKNSDSIERPFLLDSVSDCVDQWSIAGSLLIGDAAHTMSPVGGQGINIALRDTIVAANHLVPVLSAAEIDPARLDHALLVIEEERMLEVAKIQKLQSLPPKVALNRSWWGEPLRKLLSPLLARPGVRLHAASRMGEMALGVTKVRLEV